MNFYTKIIVILSLSFIAHNALAKNVALLIGISDYHHIPDLDGPKNDIVSLKKALMEHWNFKSENIVILQDSQATKTNILTAIENLQKLSAAGDEVLIYFSGHGTSVYDYQNLSSVQDVFSTNSGALIPVDFNIGALKQDAQSNPIEALKKHLITGQYHLRPLLTKLDKDRQVTVILDSCYSGHATRSLNRFNQVQFRFINLPIPTSKPEQQHRTSISFNDDSYPYKNTVSIGSSQKSQLAADLSGSLTHLTYDGKSHGLFTDVLLRILTGSISYQGELTYAKLQELIQNHIVNYNIKEAQEQKPQFQPFSDEQQHIKLMSRKLFGQHQDNQHTNVSFPTTQQKLSIKTNNKDYVIKNIDTHIFKIVDTGMIDFIVDYDQGAWSLSLGNTQEILKNSDIKTLNNRLKTAYWLKNLESKLKFTANINLVITPEDKGNHFDEGDIINFVASVSKPSSILMFNINNEGRINIIYPINPKENKIFSTNQRITVPKDQSLVIQSPFGYDQVVFIALKEPLSDYERNQLSLLLSDNHLDIDHHVFKELANIIHKKALAIRKVGIQTYKKTL